ncbi:DUF481 domain-containing protein [Akkermansiaceae bacterium]|nr:DUF481 domain-containing protein [Akkermansiaceae bacterium]
MNKTTLLSLATMTAIVSGVQAEDSKWNSSFDLGFTFTNGNSEATLLTLGVATSKREANDEYFGALSYTYGDSAIETTTNELLGSAAWNHLISERSYAGLRFDLRVDELADIDYRAGLTALAGHYFVKNDSTYFALETGIGYTVDQVGGISDSYANLYLGDRFEHKFNDKTRVYQTLSIIAPIDDIEDHSIVAEVGLETTLSDKLALKIYVQDKYEAEPAAGLDQNDVKVVTGVSYKF